MSGIERCDEPTCSAWAAVVVEHSEDCVSMLCDLHGQAFSHDEKVFIEEWSARSNSDSEGGTA